MERGVGGGGARLGEQVDRAKQKRGKRSGPLPHEKRRIRAGHKVGGEKATETKKRENTRQKKKVCAGAPRIESGKRESGKCNRGTSQPWTAGSITTNRS